MTIMEPKLTAFLEALPRADSEAFCSPPGLGGMWRVRHIRNGLERGVLVVHHSERGLAYAPYPSTHGVCRECSGKKDFCFHCACSTCSFDRMSQERASPRVSREKMLQLAARLRALTFTGPQPARVPMLDDDL